MAGAVIVEGTWDELVERAEEFRGHRLRLVVLPEQVAPEATGSLYDELKEYIGSVRGKGQSDSRDIGNQFADYLVQKHREGHL